MAGTRDHRVVSPGRKGRLVGALLRVCASTVGGNWRHAAGRPFANLVTRKGLPANSYGVPTFPANRISPRSSHALNSFLTAIW
jgi:hypothetical protein